MGAVDGEEIPGHAQGEFSNISAGYTTKLAARRSKDALRYKETKRRRKRDGTGREFP